MYLIKFNILLELKGKKKNDEQGMEGSSLILIKGI